MTPLVVHAYAKLNLGLEVLGVREDGYHELRTIFQTIDLHDVLTLRPLPADVVVRCDHPGVPGDATNLAARAALELRRFAGAGPGAEITIEKRIPVGGGLGGGSSDAAAVLLALDALWSLGLGRAGLTPIARRLGADVPFFLFGNGARDRPRRRDLPAGPPVPGPRRGRRSPPSGLHGGRVPAARRFFDTPGKGQ